MIRLVYSSPIRPQPRPRWGLGRVYLPQWYTAQRECLREWLRPVRDAIQNYSAGVEVALWVRECHGDLDNVAKAVLDALPFNDKYVTALHVMLDPSMGPAVFLQVRSYPILLDNGKTPR